MDGHQLTKLMNIPAEMQYKSMQLMVIEVFAEHKIVFIVIFESVKASEIES